MKQIWASQARRIDALSLRERVIMFASIALALAGLADMLVLSPALAERRQLTAQMRQQTQQLEALRSQLAANGPGRNDDSPEGRQRAAMAHARDEQAALDAQIRRELAGREDMARLPAVLDRLLQRHERLTLVSLASAAPQRATAAATQAALRWQAVDLSVSGQYADLLQYVAELEQTLPGLRWGPLQISTPSTPPVLTVRLMLVGEAS